MTSKKLIIILVVIAVLLPDIIFESFASNPSACDLMAKGLGDCDLSFGFGALLVAPFIFVVLFLVSIMIKIIVVKTKKRKK